MMMIMIMILLLTIMKVIMISEYPNNDLATHLTFPGLGGGLTLPLLGLLEH